MRNHDGYCPNCGIFKEGWRADNDDGFSINEWDCYDCDTRMLFPRQVGVDLTENEKETILMKRLYPRYVWRDVARRYIRIHGGYIDIDTPRGDMEGIDHLVNRHGETIATVSHHSFYTLKQDKIDTEPYVGDIPY